jgi:hypothetical protein
VRECLNRFGNGSPFCGEIVNLRRIVNPPAGLDTPLRVRQLRALPHERASYRVSRIRLSTHREGVISNNAGLFWMANINPPDGRLAPR